MIVAAAILGLGYLGLAVQNQLSVLAGGVENTGGIENKNIVDQKIKSAWDIFFEGLQSILDNEEEMRNLLSGGEDFDAIIEGKTQPLLGNLLASLRETNVNLDTLEEDYPEEVERMRGFTYAFMAKYSFGDPNSWEYVEELKWLAEYSPSEEGNKYLERLRSAYINNETALDKVMALDAIRRDLKAVLNDNPNSNEHDILHIYSLLYMYKAYHPDWEPDDIQYSYFPTIEN